MSPEAGTQKIDWRRSAPQKRSGSAGPGTLVITAVVFFANMPVTRSCTGLMNRPDIARIANASSG
jgi:hypothetical protein